MARKMPRSSGLERRKKGPLIPIRKRVVIICEGERTEPDYFHWFARQQKNQLVEYEVIPRGGPIRALIDKVIEKNRELARAARKSKDSYESSFSVWGVSDVDEHPRLEEARNLARDHGLNLVVSNPCFELWGILHFVLHDAPDGRHLVQRKLSSHMPRYSHEKNPVFQYELIPNISNYLVARKNAQALLVRREAEDNPGGPPSTNVFLLLDELLSPANRKLVFQEEGEDATEA